MKSIVKVFVLLSLMILGTSIQPVQALENDDLDVLEVFKTDLNLFYSGQDYEFFDKDGNDITNEVLSYKDEFNHNQGLVAETLINQVSTYGDKSKTFATYSIKTKSYTWSSYRIIFDSKNALIADITVTASYDTTSKKITNPNGKLTVKQSTRGTKMTSYNVSTSLYNSNKSIHYNYKVNARISRSIKSVTFTKNWTPKF